MNVDTEIASKVIAARTRHCWGGGGNPCSPSELRKEVCRNVATSLAFAVARRNFVKWCHLKGVDSENSTKVPFVL